MSKKHLQGRWTKYNDRWVISIAAGQGRTPTVGDEITIHKSNGDLQRYTLTKKITQLQASSKYGAGKITYLFEGQEGWGLQKVNTFILDAYQDVV